MKKELGTDPRACQVAIAPSIGPCCFRVDDQVASIFKETFRAWEDLIIKVSNKWNIDLWRLNLRQLVSSGVPESNIALSSLCTACNSDMFFSYRRDRKNSGRMAALLALKK
jgi:copper oxidase (laccase) domain-containing protein